MMDLIKNIIKVLDGPFLYVLLFCIVVILYLLIALFNKSLIKPLKYLSIPTIISGLIFIIFRFSFKNIVSIALPDYSNIINIVLPKVLNSILNIGIVYTIIGVILLILYIILNKRKKSLS